MKVLFNLCTILTFVIVLFTSCTEEGKHISDKQPVVQSSSASVNQVTKTWVSPHDKQPLLTREYNKNGRHTMSAQKH